MARKLSSARINGAYVLPLLVASGVLGCSSEPSAPSTETVDRVIYAVRQHTSPDGLQIDVAGGMGQVMDYGRYNPGGRLELYDVRTGKVENIIDGFATADISSLDVSFDATKVVFTMKESGDDYYQVYWSALTRGADGKFEIHKLTFAPNDKEHAVFVAGDRIAFITNESYTEMGTRADEYNHSRVVTQIAVMPRDGGEADIKRCSQNLSHTINLFTMADGRIGFSRWEHLENVNDVKLFAMNPDCTQMVALSGQHGKPGNSLVQAAETNTSNVFLAIATERENTIQAGALVKIDTRSEHDELRVDEERADYTELTPSVPTSEDPSPIGRYRTPQMLPDGRILVSWADGRVNESNERSLTPPDFGLYIYDAGSRSNKLLMNHDKSWEVYGQPVVQRAEPPIISSVQTTVDAAIAAVFGSIDVRQTSLYSVHGNRVSGAQFDGTPLDDALKQATRVRIIEGFSSEGSPGNTMFGLTMAEGAALLGEAPVYADGSWRAAIPPYVPVHLQPIDEFDLAIRNQTTWIQGMPGEDRTCGGCHESRTSPSLPGGQVLTTAASRAPEMFNLPVAQRVEYPWYRATDTANANEIQKILSARCESCHNATQNGGAAQTFYSVTMEDPDTGVATTYEIPRFDMSAREITVMYDMEVKSWPASYVSLFYPSALAMEMDDAEVVGTVPPMWAVPSDARNSVVIEKLNVTSTSDAARYAWPLGVAFSDATVQGTNRTDHAQVADLTRDELVKLIRAIDMGGQYYARQNSDYQPNSNDPVSGSSGKQY